MMDLFGQQEGCAFITALDDFPFGKTSCRKDCLARQQREDASDDDNGRGVVTRVESLIAALVDLVYRC